MNRDSSTWCPRRIANESVGAERLTSMSRHIRTLHEVGVAAGLTDQQLLDRFNGRRSQASEADAAAEMAFAAIVARHGPMVLGVCQRAVRSGRR